MATVRKRNNKYIVIYDYITVAGERKQKWETYKTKSAADKRAKEIEYEKSRNTFITPNDQTVAEFLAEWAPMQAQTNWQYKTYMSNMQMIEQHINPLIGHVVLQRLTPKHIDAMFVKLRNKKVSGSRAHGKKEEDIPRLSSTSQRHIYVLLKGALNKAVEWRLISENPVVCAPPERSTQETASWDVDTFRMALDMIDDDLLHLAVHIAFVCSLRIGEAMAIGWDDIDLNNREIHIRKTLQRVSREALNELPKDLLYFMFPPKQENKKSVLILKKPKTDNSIRTIYITDELCAELMGRWDKIQKQKALLDHKYMDYNLVFALNDGSPIEPKLCEKWFKKWQDDAGLAFPDIVFHGIRHSSATYKLALSHGDIKAVQGDTGHASARMVTDTYAHMQDSSRKELRNMVQEDFYRKKDSPASSGGQTDETKKSSQSVDINNLLTYLENHPEEKNKLLAGLFSQNNT